MGKRTTILDIARATGYSKATVSLALRNHASIPKDTRDGIQRVARNMDYRPDPLLSSIAAQRWERRKELADTVVVYLWNCRDKIVPHDKKILELTKVQAEKMGYHLEAIDYSAYHNHKSLRRVLKARGVRGVLIAPIRQEKTLLELDWDLYSCLCYGIGHYVLPLHIITTDYFSIGRQICTMLQERGYRRMGAILYADQKSDHLAQKIGGILFEQYMKLDQHTDLPIHYLNHHESPTQQVRHLAKWLEIHTPEVVVGQNAYLHDLLLQTGLRIPQDLAFLSFSKDLDQPHVAGFYTNKEIFVQTGMQFLDSMIRANETGLPEQRKKILIEGVFVSGQSLPDGRDFVPKSALLK